MNYFVLGSVFLTVVFYWWQTGFPVGAEIGIVNINLCFCWLLSLLSSFGLKKTWLVLMLGVLLFEWSHVLPRGLMLIIFSVSLLAPYLIKKYINEKYSFFIVPIVSLLLYEILSLLLGAWGLGYSQNTMYDYLKNITWIEFIWHGLITTAMIMIIYLFSGNKRKGMELE